MFVTLKNEDLALEQLHCAIELFLADRFIPAITLAGAAEECKAVSHGRNSLDMIARFITSIGRSAGRTENQIKVCNRVRNSLKHGDQGGAIEFNPQLEAYLLIARSIENYQRLGKPKSNLMHQFGEAARNIG